MPEVDPVLGLLLDPASLSRIVGRDVRVTRVRPKPGVSHVGALLEGMSSEGAGPGGGRPVGWVLALVGEDRAKRDKRVRTVAEHRPQAVVGEAALPALDAHLLWGDVGSDPALVKALAEVDLSAGTLLRYNPLRRVVVRLGDHVVRVTAHPHRDRLTRVARTLAGHGVPVTVPVPAAQAGLRGSRRTTVWPWLEGHDLSARATRGQLEEAGRLLASLHGAPVSAVEGLGLHRRGWAQVHAAAAAGVRLVEQVAPEVAGPLRRALAALPPADADERAAGLHYGPDVVLHGDFSLDQCLAGETGLVLTDFDRAAVGPADVDLASALAVSLLDGTDVAPLLVAYREPRGAAYPQGEPAHGPAPAWVAAAVLARAAEPWRAQRPGWADETVRRGELALGLMTASDPRGYAVPAVVESPAGDRVEVVRAWPDKVVDGVPWVAVEGPDQHGRLRAGTVDRAGRVRLLPAGDDARLPALAGVAGRGRLVVHRAGRRAVVALPEGYVKLVRPGRAPGVAGLSRRGGALAAAASLGAARVASVTDDAVTFDVVPGRPVHELSETAGWEDVWALWSEAWTRWQRLEAPDLPEHTANDEAGVLHTWRERAVRTGVLAGTPWPDRLERTARDLAGGDDVLGAPARDARRLVPTHRDLHDRQLLWDGRRLSVLDLDTVCLAEPAVDLANLAVHARLRQAQGRWSARATDVVLQAVERVRLASGSEPGRMALAERATVARLAAVYAFRPPWRTTVHGWAEQEWARLAR